MQSICFKVLYGIDGAALKVTTSFQVLFDKLKTCDNKLVKTWA